MAGPEKNRERYTFGIVFGTLLLLDQVTKLYFAKLPLCIQLTGYHLFCQFRNYGSYSNPSGKVGIFDLLPVEIGTLVVTSLSLFLWYRFFYYKDRLTIISLGLLTSGILGNFTDRLLRGYVIDGISMAVIGKPIIFNLADAYISLGVTLLLLAFVRYVVVIGRYEKRGLFQLRTPHKVVASFIGSIIFVSLSALLFAFVFNQDNRQLFSLKEFILVGGYILTITALVTLSTLLFMHRTLGPLERLLDYVANQDYSKKFEFRAYDLLGYLDEKLEAIRRSRLERFTQEPLSFALKELNEAKAQADTKTKTTSQSEAK